VGWPVRISVKIYPRAARFVLHNSSLLYFSLLLHCIALDSSATQSQLIADAVKRSSIAHLFHFYRLLCDIASIPRKTPSTWVLSEASHQHSSHSLAANRVSEETTGRGSIGSWDIVGDGIAVELDARMLARDSLKEIGKEMGVI